MVTASMRLSPARAAVLTAAVDEHVMRSDGREPADPTDVVDPTERGDDVMVAMIQRSCRAIRELGSLELIAELSALP